MNLDIISQNVLVYVSIAFSVLGTFVVFNLYKAAPDKKLKSKKDKLKYLMTNRLFFALVPVGGILLAILLMSIFSSSTQSPLPGSFVLMCLPFTFTLGFLLLAIFYKKKLVWWTVGTLVMGLLFSLVLVNDYYGYFPTLGEVFGQNSAQTLKDNQATVTVRYVVSAKQSTYNDLSIQKSLASLSSAPTTGALYKINIPGTVSKFNARSGYVYVPAIYNSVAEINLPVIVLTAGVPGTPDNWVNTGLESIMDQFAASHTGITPLVFAVDNTGALNNDTECVNSSRGNVETYLTIDVPNYIKANFHVDTSPGNWAIGGLSMGGMCSMMLTLRHPDVYSYFIDLGGETGPEVGNKQNTIYTLFQGSEKNWAEHQPDIIMSGRTFKNIGGFFAYGNQDNGSIAAGINTLSYDSKKAGIDTVTEVIDGSHTFTVWGQAYKDAIPWISNRIGATQCSPSCL